MNNQRKVFFNDENDEELDPFDEILGDEEQPKKPFGNEEISEDEAVALRSPFAVLKKS